MGGVNGKEGLIFLVEVEWIFQILCDKSLKLSGFFSEEVGCPEEYDNSFVVLEEGVEVNGELSFEFPLFLLSSQAASHLQ